MADPPWFLIAHLLRRGRVKVGAELPTMVTTNGSGLQRLGTRALVFMASCRTQITENAERTWFCFSSLGLETYELVILQSGTDQNYLFRKAVQLYTVSISCPVTLKT